MRFPRKHMGITHFDPTKGMSPMANEYAKAARTLPTIQGN
jgi:hypothetical protein